MSPIRSAFNNKLSL